MGSFSLFGLSSPFRSIYIGFATGKHLWELYLDWRQLKKNYEKEVPEEAVSMVSEKTYLKSQAYNQDKRIFGMWSSSISLVADFFSGLVVFPYMWNLSASLLENSGWNSEPIRYMLTMFLSGLVDKIVSVPLSLYKDFVVEEKHGFNKKTLGLFVTDLLKGEVLGLLVTLALLFPAVKIVEWAGPKFPLYLLGFSQVSVIVLMFIFPTVIQPLFNKVEPLKDQELNSKIEVLAGEHKFPLTKIYQIDGSKRSSHSNAYFYGFWKNKRIVLFDTLLDMSHGEILAVLCHEIGHWFYNHVLSSMVILSFQLFVLFQSAQICSDRYGGQLLKEFGFGRVDGWKGMDGKGLPVTVFITLFTRVYAPLSYLFEVSQIFLSRSREFQADQYASEAGRKVELASALRKLQNDNLGDVNPDWLFSAMHHTHPPVVERIRALGVDPSSLPALKSEDGDSDAVLVPAEDTDDAAANANKQERPGGLRKR